MNPTLNSIQGYDWDEVFSYASKPETVTFGKKASVEPFTKDDVVAVIGAIEGENDGNTWIVYGRLEDGRFFFIEAGCDYTGWDCQSSGNCIVAATKQSLIQFGMNTEARERFALK